MLTRQLKSPLKIPREGANGNNVSADDENIERGKIVLFFKELEEVPARAAKLRTMSRSSQRDTSAGYGRGGNWPQISNVSKKTSEVVD